MPSSVGYLYVRTSAADQALPVSGAQVVIYCPDTDTGTPCDRSTTDENGQSKLFTLATPPPEDSETAEGSSAFRNYTIRIDHPDYLPVQIFGAAVFPGITSTLPVTLIPAIPGQERSLITITITQTGPSGSGGNDG